MSVCAHACVYTLAHVHTAILSKSQKWWTGFIHGYLTNIRKCEKEQWNIYNTIHVS